VEGEAGDPGYLRIGELGRRVGVAPETIRAWERRYSLLTPRRTAGGFRLYGDGDVARLRAMQSHVRSGLAPAEAARLVRDGVAPPPVAQLPAVQEAGAVEREAAALSEALERFDDTGANAAIDTLLGAFSVDVVVDRVLIPFLHELGERWERGEITVGQEHYASNLVRARLLGLARGWGRVNGPRAVLACVPGEQHDLGLLCFGVALRDHGWRIDYLGADTPIETVGELVPRVSPAAVVLVMELEAPTPWLDDARRLADEVTLAVAGRAMTPELAGRLSALHLQDSPAAAARVLAASA
jgi:DNA-binding transcriptional MerR regulator